MSEPLPTPQEVREEADKAFNDWHGYGPRVEALIQAYEQGRLVTVDGMPRSDQDSDATTTTRSG